MVIKHNISAKNSYRHLGNNTTELSSSLEKLSSGYKINRAADNAAGLAISEKMRASITGHGAAENNCKDGVSLTQTADGAIEEIHAMLNRVSELATLAANGTYTDSDRAHYQAEIDELTAEMDRIVQTTNFNGIPLLNRDTIITDTGLDDTVTNSYNYYTHAEMSGGLVESASSSTIYSTNYISSDISVPSQALSVPSTADLPYVIEMNICTYNDSAFDDDSASITNKTVVLTVDKDAGGNISVIGTTGTYTPPQTYADSTNVRTVDFTDMATKTSYDVANGLAGVPFVGGTSGSIVSTSQMTYIMENLLNSVPNSLNAGGYTGYDTYDLYTLNKDQFNADGIFYNNGWKDADGETIYSSTVTSYADQNYGATTSWWGTGEYYDDLYGNNMNIYGYYSYPTNTGRVLGVEFSVNANGSELTTSTTPSGFDHTDWDAASDMEDLVSGDILGANSAAQTNHFEVKISDTFYTGAEVAAMSDAQLKDLIITLDRVTESTYLNGTLESEVRESDSYAVIIAPIPVELSARLSALEVEIVEVDPNEPTHYYIEDLCDAIYGGTGLQTTRKLDDQKYDLYLDDNETDRYTLQVQTFTSKIIKKTTSTIEEVDPIIIQAGISSEEYDKIKIYINNMEDDVDRLSMVDVTSVTSANDAIGTVAGLIEDASINRAKIGAYQNRLERAINVNSVAKENLSSAESRMRDVDVAEEMMNLTKSQILQQSSQSMLAHASQQPEGVLQLLQ